MKKQLLLLIIFTLTGYKNFSQIIFYDASNIRDNCVIPGTEIRFKTDAVSVRDLSSYLRNYLPDSVRDNDSLTEIQVLQQFSSNPFIETAIRTLIGGGMSPSLAGFFSKASSAIGGLDVTTFADGLAKFLVKRSKQELYVSFFENFHEKIIKNYPEFAVLFPHTTLLVNNFESWEYANIINTLREAFDKDIKEILLNLPKILSIDLTSVTTCGCSAKALIRVKKIQDFFATDPKGSVIFAAFFLGGELISGKRIPVIIEDISSGQVISHIHLPNAQDQANLISAIKLLKIVSNSIRSNDLGRDYQRVTDLTTLLGVEQQRTLFFALLYQQIKNENISFNGKNLANEIKTTTTKINGIIQYIRNFLNKTEGFSHAVASLSKAKKEGMTDLSEYWAAIFESAKDVLPAIVNIEVIDPGIHLPAGVTNIIEASSKTIEIAQDISVRNYSAVIVDILKILSESKVVPDDFKEFIVKYGSFAANVVQSKNSDDVENAIEAIALPVGSASIKKNTEWNVALNAYLGGFYGNEYLSEKKAGKWRPISGVYAPVGVTISKGLGKNIGSLSLLVSVIDIGAVASFRLTDTSTEKLPKLTLQNIFSPGLGLVYGIPKWPISIGYSYQLGPVLRKITETDKVVSDKLNSRWQFFLAVDIPLINFYTKPK